jgi:hypothetical protein
MPVWAWVVIIVAIVVLLGVATWAALSKRRTSRLQSRFGPEYDRAVGSAESKRTAESELAAREERRRKLEIRPLSEAARTRYLETWRVVQAQFVDDPRASVGAADSLIQSVMIERGYPVEDFDQRASDISVDHPHVVENYREGHRLAEATAEGRSSTEDLRQAMRHYRALFDELVEPAGDEPMRREQLEGEPATAAGSDGLPADDTTRRGVVR